MQRRRPVLQALAGMAALALAAAACGGGDTGSSAAPATGAPATPAESVAPSGSGAAESMAPSGSPGTGSGFVFEELGGEVSVLATWTGSEQDSFMAMIQPWIDGTGVKVNYTGTRDLATQITTGIASGNLPDVAGLPGPGQMADWYDQGALKPLDFVDYAAYESSTPAGSQSSARPPTARSLASSPRAPSRASSGTTPPSGRATLLRRGTT